jgi:hypothetical protein
MCCVAKVGRSTTSGLIHLRLIAREAKHSIGRDSYRPAENSRVTGGQVDVIRNGLLDSEHTNPEHVWGDEGPVNDQ